MKTVGHWFTGLVLAAAALLSASCSTSKTTEEEPLTPASAPAEERAMPTPGETIAGCPGDRIDEPKQCVSNEDCCQGFSCSFDPDRSHRIKYCLDG